MYQWLVKFQNMDRRWVFLGMAVAIVIPMLVPFKLPIVVDEPVRKIYTEVESLEAGDAVYLSADFDPASAPELEPFYRAILHQLFRKDVRVVMGTLWPTAPPLIKPILEEIAEIHGAEYGVDWTYLGFTDGRELAIKSLGESVRRTYPKDSRGNETASLEVMAGLDPMSDFDLLVSVSAGFPGTQEYVLMIQSQYNLTMVSACTAVSAPDYIAFYTAEQLAGLAGGMPASAQYEQLVFPDGAPEGIRLMASQNVNVLNLGHLYIIILIILGNVAYFITRGRGV